MKLTEMRALLAKRDIQLTKSLGQNFLHDTNQLRRIVDAAELTSTDKVLEIGPGLGPLTELLLEEAGEVLAIEMDARLVAVLQERFKPLTPGLSSDGERESEKVSDARMQAVPSPLPSSPMQARENDTRPLRGGLTLLHDDALEFIRREPRDWTDWKLVANLPYSVASPILVELAQSPKRPKCIVVTLQLEVAQRLMSGADDDDYGVLTLLVQLDYEAGSWFKIPADCFFPIPGVDSACVTLRRRPQTLLPEEQRRAFVRIVKRAFSQRRKMMLKLLKQDWPAEKLERVFTELNISLQERAEKLSLEQFVALTRLLSA